MLKIDPVQISISEATEADRGAIREILDEACRWLADQGIRQWTVPFSEEYIRQKIAAREFQLINLARQPAGVFRLKWSDFGEPHSGHYFNEYRAPRPSPAGAR